MKRHSLFYVITLALTGLAIMYMLHLGGALPAPAGAATVKQAASVQPADASAVQVMQAGLMANFHHPLSHLFVQLLVIIGVSRVMGKIFTKLGQPSVVGEMAAGILLGPSLFGLLSPGAFAFVFPPISLDALKLLSQVGVCLFMFSVGMELDVRHVRNKAHTAVLVSHASIVFPYLLGVVQAYFSSRNWRRQGRASRRLRCSWASR